MTAYSHKDDEDYKSYVTLSQIDCCLDWKYTKDKRHIEKLLERTKNINYQIPAKGRFVSHDERMVGSTALHLACNNYWHEDFREVCESIRIMFKYYADTTVKNALGLTPLLKLMTRCEDRHGIHEWSYARKGRKWTREGSFKCGCVSRLLWAQIESNKHENPCNEHGFSHFHVACMANHSEAIKFFLEHGVDVNQTVSSHSPNFPGYGPLHFAVISCELETVETLLKSGADLFLKDANGMTPVHQLLKSSVDLFNDRDIDIDEKSSKADRELRLSDIERNEQVVDLFFKNERILKLSVLDESGLSVLHLASILKSESLIEQLLINDTLDVNQVINVNSPVCPGFTPLHLAAMFNLDIAMILLKKGADPTIKDAKGQSPLDIFLNQYSVKEIHAILSTQPTWRNIVMSDGKTKLLDIVHSIRNNLKAPKRKYLFVPMDAPLWPGYTLLHLAVLFSERDHAQFREQDNSNEEKMNCKNIQKCLQWNRKAVTVQDAHGSTPLHLGFMLRKRATVKILIHHCGKENPVNKDNLSHFHIACAETNGAAIKSLMVNADINAPVSSNYEWFFCSTENVKEVHSLRIKSGYAPLHILLESGNYPVAKFLVKRGADINVTDDSGMTPIHMLFRMSLRYNQLGELTKVFWSHPDLKDVLAKDSGVSHLHVAITHDDAEAVERLLKLGADPNAAISKESAVLPLMMECNAGDTPLQLTRLIYKNDAKIIDLLLRHGADVSIVARDVGLLKDILCKITSIRTSNLEENEALQNRICELTGLTMLHVACYLCDLESVKNILKNDKTDVNAQVHLDFAYGGCTPLHFLMLLNNNDSQFGNDVDYGDKIVSVCKLLLENGANVASWNDHGGTTIHVAVAHSYASKGVSRALAICTEAMLDKYDFSKNLVNKDGISLFHVACRMNDVEAAKKFLEHGANVNEPIDPFLCYSNADKYAGFTPLHLCLTHQYSSRMVDLLLEYGADVHAQNVKGDTPLHCAALRSEKRQEIFEKLIAAGADVNAENVYSETPLAVALRAEKATPQEIKLFHKHGYMPNYFNNATQRGFMTYICKRGIDDKRLTDAMLNAPGFCEPDEMGRTGLHNVVASGESHLECREYVTLIEKLTKRGCTVDFQDNSGQTALHYAALFSNAEAVSALLLAGAYINVVDDEDNTPYACALNPYEAIYNVEMEYDGASNCESTVKILANHVHQLQLLKLYVSKANVKIQEELIERGYWESSCFKNYLKIDLILEPYTCSEELKTYPIGRSSFTCGDFLTEAGVVFAYPTMTQEDRKAIDKFIQCKRLRKLGYPFGDHAKFLKLQYQKALARKTLLEQATDSLVTITQFLLPAVCAHATVRLLCNDDLKNIIAVADELNPS